MATHSAPPSPTVPGSDACPRAPVVVLGAGLTGMSTAYHLQQAGISYRLLERCDRPGGLVITDEEQGFRFDRTGHLLHGGDAESARLALEWIGPDHHRLERHARIWSHGRYTRYPFQAHLRDLPPLVGYECLLGFVRAWAARERRTANAPAPRTFREFCDQSFGRGIAEHFMVPYNSRLWGVGPEQITAEWCARFVPVPTIEDVVAGMFDMGDRALGYNAEFIYPRLGIGRLSEGLAGRLDSLELGRTVVGVDAARRRVLLEGETVGYDVLVSTAPLPALVGLLADAPDAVRAAADRLRATGLWYLDLAIAHPCPHPFHWIYVPEPSYPFYRVGCYSNFSSAMAPSGQSGLYVELVDRAEPVLHRLLPSVLDALAAMGLVRGRESLRFARPRRIDCAYVVFEPESNEALETVQRYLRSVGVLSVGRYGGWNYSSMTDAIAFGQAAARDAQRLLAGEPLDDAR